MLNEQQFEELLQTTIPEACYEEACEMEEHMIKKGKHVFSEEYEKNMKAIFKGKKRIVNKVTSTKRKAKPKFKYLLVAILLLILSSITVLAYEPARERIKDFFYSIYQEYLLFHPVNSEGNMDLTEIILLKPSYVPSGYELVDETVNENLKSVFLMWIDDTENILWYEQRTSETGEMVLSSDGNLPTDIKIGENTGKLVIEEDGTNTIFWEENNSLFIVSGVIEQKELIQILLSLK